MRRARRQAARAAVVSRPKKRHGKRLRSSRTTRDVRVWRSENIRVFYHKRCSSATCVCIHRHCEPTGRRRAPPDDRLREPIHFFVAAAKRWIASSQVLLAMTLAAIKKRGPGPRFSQKLIVTALLADGGG